MFCYRYGYHYRYTMIIGFANVCSNERTRMFCYGHRYRYHRRYTRISGIANIYVNYIGCGDVQHVFICYRLHHYYLVPSPGLHQLPLPLLLVA